MKSPLYVAAVALACGFLSPAAAHADAAKAAVFDFELDDTSLQGEMRGQDAGDIARLARLDTQLRDALTQSGRYTPIAVATGAAEPFWWTCDGCEVEPARTAGAAVSVIGWVQKVSNLILNINVVVRDTGSGQTIAAGSVDIRGDTDESWTHGLSYLMRKRILGEPNSR